LGLMRWSLRNRRRHRQPLPIAHPDGIVPLVTSECEN